MPFETGRACKYIDFSNRLARGAVVKALEAGLEPTIGSTKEMEIGSRNEEQQPVDVPDSREPPSA